jgi:hypothetical protein
VAIFAGSVIGPESCEEVECLGLAAPLDGIGRPRASDCRVLSSIVNSEDLVPQTGDANTRCNYVSRGSGGQNVFWPFYFTHLSSKKSMRHKNHASLS